MMAVAAEDDNRVAMGQVTARGVALADPGPSVVVDAHEVGRLRRSVLGSVRSVISLLSDTWRQVVCSGRTSQGCARSRGPPGLLSGMILV